MKFSTFFVLVSCLPFIFWAAEGKTGGDPCSSYLELNGADRARTFNQDTGKSDVNDLQADNWYRFTGEAGFKLGQRYQLVRRRKGRGAAFICHLSCARIQERWSELLEIKKNCAIIS